MPKPYHIIATEDGNGYNMPYFTPDSRTDVFTAFRGLLSGDYGEGDKEAILAYFSELGYSKERILELCESAEKTAKMIDDFGQNPELDGYFHYYRPVVFENKGVEVPVFEILNELGYKTDEKIFTDFCPDFYLLRRGKRGRFWRSSRPAQLARLLGRTQDPNRRGRGLRWRDLEPAL